jgi:hypothetical protein
MKNRPSLFFLQMWLSFVNTCRLIAAALPNSSALQPDVDLKFHASNSKQPSQMLTASTQVIADWV